MRRTSLVVGAFFAASMAFAQSTAIPKAPQAPAKAVQQTKSTQQAGGQSGGASTVVAGGVAATEMNPALIALGVAAVAVVVAVNMSDSSSNH